MKKPDNHFPHLLGASHTAPTGGSSVIRQEELTTSSARQDIERCYAAGANSYVHKPVNLEGFFQAISRLKDFWFGIAVLPKEE